MAMTVHVDIVSTEASIFSGLAEFLVIPAEMGEIGIFPNHAPLITTIKPGAIRLKIPDQKQEELIYVSSGILEIQAQVVTILSDTAIRAKDIDEKQATEAKREVEEAMKHSVSKTDFAKLQAELARALAQIHVVEILHKKM
ncbi:MAG: F0F1 ATP synthase subunit epsilon [Sulfuriferula sp.]